jgi:hypothetical protein
VTQNKFMQTPPEIELDEFTRAYIMAALWTFDEDAFSGEYSTSGRFEILFPKIDREAVLKMVEDCAKFKKDNAALIHQAELKDSRAGHNFWLSRNGHGSGFFDEYSQTECEAYEKEHAIAVKTRDFSKREALMENCPCRYHACERLQEISRTWGTVDIYFGDDKKIYAC